MSSTAEQITMLQQRLKAAQREHLRAEGAREAAQAALDRAQQRLFTEWQITGLPAAKQALARLTGELDEAVAALNRLLDVLDDDKQVTL